MAELFIKHYPPSGYLDGQPKYILEMDETEFVNLRWLMDMIYSDDHPGHSELNTGPWCGQIRYALVDGIDGLRVDTRPDAQE